MPSRLRLEFLDGIRGLSALYVVFFHAVARFEHADVSRTAWALVSPLLYGEFAVSVFIVLSGYCLMLPVAKRGALEGGFRGYLGRRARRILPPYYAALFLSVAIIAVSQILRQSATGRLGPRAAMLSADNLLAHIFVVHNLAERWNQSLNPPLWSVATEWHIYFVFPLLLLPIWRRFGLAATVLGGFAAGLAPWVLKPMDYDFAWARPWYVGLFALGMAGAVIGVEERRQPVRERVPWGAVALGLGAVLVVLCRFWWKELTKHDSPWAPAVDTLVGLAAVAAIVALACPQGEQIFDLRRLLEAKWAARLGAFSYSLYLVHVPLQDVFYHLLSKLKLSDNAEFAAMLAGGPAVSLVGAYLFYLAVERRFTSWRPAPPSAAPR